VRALIFDFDGLIVDTETPEVDTWREVFLEHGVEFPDSYWMSCIGRGADQIMETPGQLLERCCGRSLPVAEIASEHHRRVMERIHRQPPRPGIPELLADARAEGLRLAVASSSKHDWVDRHLHRLGLFSYFDFTVCADDVPRAKPFPDLYLAASERLKVTKEESMALEDSPNGITAARAAGIFVTVVPNPLTAQMDVSHASARLESLAGATVGSLRELLRDDR
jgi:HAD superfamily hydrolase (TIGR01509 family)